MFSSVPSRTREPLFNVPVVIVALISLMTLIHLWRETLGDEADFRLIAAFAFVPARLTAQFDTASVFAALVELAGQGANGASDANAMHFLLGGGELKPWTFLTYAGLHADFAHIGLNCLWLLAFGSALARRFGPARFLGFFTMTAVAGAFAHWMVHPVGLAPVIGASAAVSGAMAGAVRFAFQPGGPLARRSPGSGMFAEPPALPLLQVFTNPRVWPFVAVWFTVNLVTGIGAIPLGLSESGIAWEAHIGGFVAGLVLFDLFDPVRSQQSGG